MFCYPKRNNVTNKQKSKRANNQKNIYKIQYIRCSITIYGFFFTFILYSLFSLTNTYSRDYDYSVYSFISHIFICITWRVLFCWLYDVFSSFFFLFWSLLLVFFDSDLSFPFHIIRTRFNILLLSLLLLLIFTLTFTCKHKSVSWAAHWMMMNNFVFKCFLFSSLLSRWILCGCVW